MVEELSDIEMRILGFLQEHEERYGETACYLDSLFSGISPDEMLKDEGKFTSAIKSLEENGYIKSMAVDTHHATGTKFGCYKLSRRGRRVVKG